MRILDFGIPLIASTNVPTLRHIQRTNLPPHRCTVVRRRRQRRRSSGPSTASWPTSKSSSGSSAHRAAGRRFMRWEGATGAGGHWLTISWAAQGAPVPVTAPPPPPAVRWPANDTRFHAASDSLRGFGTLTSCEGMTSTLSSDSSGHCAAGGRYMLWEGRVGGGSWLVIPHE